MKPDFTEQIKGKTDKELSEIFINANDYNPDFVALAEQELVKRNIDMTGARRKKIVIKQIDARKLTEGKPGSPLYILFCFVLSLLGGVIAIYAGYIYSQSSIKNHEGDKFYVYNKQTRQLGKIMMWTGITVFVLLIFRRLLAT